jgi:hypothetical protein
LGFKWAWLLVCPPIERVGDEPEPFNGFVVGGDDGGRGAVSFHDEFVDVGSVEGVEWLERGVVDDQQVDAQQF